MFDKTETFTFEKKRSVISEEIIAALGRLDYESSFNDKTLLENIQNHQIKRISDEATNQLQYCL